MYKVSVGSSGTVGLVTDRRGTVGLVTDPGLQVLLSWFTVLGSTVPMSSAGVWAAVLFGVVLC